MNYQKCYSILGVFQDDDRETVRSAYKRQIHRWHPDRFHDPDKRRIAEDKCKEINFAYQVLDNYFQEHGELPPGNAPTQSAPTVDGPQPPNEHRSGFGAGHITDPEGSSGGEHRPTRRGYAGILLTVVAVAGVYALSEPLLTGGTGEAEPDHFGFADTESPSASFALRQTESITTNETGNIVGRSPDGHVHWNDGEATPESSENLSQGRRLPYITRGSTKQEVLAIQGRPLRTTDTAWDYGLSRINFRDGKVTDWYENPMNPLIVQR